MHVEHLQKTALEKHVTALEGWLQDRDAELQKIKDAMNEDETYRSGLNLKVERVRVGSSWKLSSALIFLNAIFFQHSFY